eukprot:m.37243 g.37243  ORF g.37243 m.37243 type:complete len:319 (-) comp5436_c0_seq1:317-1273(-)
MCVRFFFAFSGFSLGGSGVSCVSSAGALLLSGPAAPASRSRQSFMSFFLPFVPLVCLSPLCSARCFCNLTQYALSSSPCSRLPVIGPAIRASAAEAVSGLENLTIALVLSSSRSTYATPSNIAPSDALEALSGSCASASSTPACCTSGATAGAAGSARRQPQTYVFNSRASPTARLLLYSNSIHYYCSLTGGAGALDGGDLLALQALVLVLEARPLRLGQHAHVPVLLCRHNISTRLPVRLGAAPRRAGRAGHAVKVRRAAARVRGAGGGGLSGRRKLDKGKALDAPVLGVVARQADVLHRAIRAECRPQRVVRRALG